MQELTKGLRERLRTAGFDAPALPDAELSGITIVPVANGARIVDQLQAERISAMARGAGVRFAVHAFNNGEDLDRAVEALARIARG